MSLPNNFIFHYYLLPPFPNEAASFYILYNLIYHEDHFF
nr:MAG TPA_asm: hypothetical protein [Caudoviricetes sp.]